MKCLKCDNDVLPGKALCAACFSAHQANVAQVGSDEWVNQKLKETREKARQRQGHGERPSLKTDLQNAFLKLAPVLIGCGALAIFASWFIRSGGVQFARYSPPKAAHQDPNAQPTSISNLGTEGVEHIANQAVVAADAVPTPAESTTRGFEDQRPWNDQIDTPTATPTSTPTETPTETPTQTPEPS
jgi:hypothetical protein